MNEAIAETAPKEKRLPWPTSAEFMADESQPEALAIAAVEILSVLEHVNKAVVKCAASILPQGAKMAFITKMRNTVRQLFLSVPNQQLAAVEALIAAELFGDQAEEITNVGGVVATGKTSASNPEVAGSNPESPATPTQSVPEYQA